MTKGSRVLFAALEWFFPSYYRGFEFLEKLMIYFFHVFMVAIPFMPIMMVVLAFANKDYGALIGAAIFMLFPLLHFSGYAELSKNVKIM